MLSDEAVLALSSLIGSELSVLDMGMETAMAGAALLVSGTHNTILYSVLISYVVAQLLLLPLSNVFIAALLLVVSTNLEQVINIKVSTVVTYTVAEAIAGDLLNMSHQASSVLYLLLTIALVTYISDTRQYGVLGTCSFRVAKFVLVRQGVQYVLNTGTALIFHPIMWIAFVIIAINLVHSLRFMKHEQLELADAIVHTSASSVTLILVGIPTQVSSMEIMILLASFQIGLSALPPSPARTLGLSLVIYLAIINIKPLGLLSVTLLLLADKSLSLETKPVP